MLTRVRVLLVIAGCFAGLQGCVSADVYKLKEQEVQTLNLTNQEIQFQNRALKAEKIELKAQTEQMKEENEGLKGRVEKQNGEISALKAKAEKIEKEGDALRGQVEKLNVKITDLNKENQRLAALTRPENLLRSLGEKIAELQKHIETLAVENDILKNRPAVIRAEEEKAGEAAPEGGAAPAVAAAPAAAVPTLAAPAEKQQPVSVSTDQKAEEIKLEPKTQERRRRSVFPGTANYGAP